MALRRRLAGPLAQTVKQRGTKQLAIATRIPWRTLENLRAGERLCNLEDALLILRDTPNSPFAREVQAFLSGDGVAASPANINVMVRFLSSTK